VTAGISRPFSGKLTDRVGRVPVMAIGSLVCVVCGCLYPALHTVASFLVLRLFHGFSVGFKPTATSAYIADITPGERWGEAMGIHSICFSSGLAIGPALGSLIASHYPIQVLFYASSSFALCSIVILMNMQETLPVKQTFTLRMLRIHSDELIEPRVLPAAVATFLSYVPYGVTVTLMPDWAQSLGVTNKGSFFIYLTLASLLMRFVAGKAADEHGRVLVMQIASVFLVIALLLIAVARGPSLLMTGAIVYGIASGLLSPASSAWTSDLSHPERRGKAMATMYISLEAGIGLGAAISGWIFCDQIARVPWIFGTTALVALAGLVYLLVYERVSARQQALEMSL
jgi:MFS family permease